MYIYKANKVIQSKRNIEKAKKKAEEELRKSKKTKPLKDKEAEEIVKNIQKVCTFLRGVTQHFDCYTFGLFNFRKS